MEKKELLFNVKLLKINNWLRQFAICKLHIPVSTLQLKITNFLALANFKLFYSAHRNRKWICCLSTFLIFIYFTGFSTSSKAENHRDFANDIAIQDTKLTIQNMQKIFSEYFNTGHFNFEHFNSDNENINEFIKPKAKLQIFVSSSMPKTLLQNYAKEATLYDAVLVFRGLPEGSFRALSDLVMSISDDSGSSAAMQIDDEAFAKYKVTTVPTIILSKESAFLDFDSDKARPIYDKVQGNIAIKYALELFADSGELRKEAQGALQ